MLFVNADGGGVEVTSVRPNEAADHLIRHLRSRGVTVQEIADALNRSKSWVEKRLTAMRRRDLEEAAEGRVTPVFGPDPSWSPAREPFAFPPGQLPEPPAACPTCGAKIEPGSGLYCPSCTRSGHDDRLRDAARSELARAVAAEERRERERKAQRDDARRRKLARGLKSA